jgi:hypothetical protein
VKAVGLFLFAERLLSRGGFKWLFQDVTIMGIPRDETVGPIYLRQSFLLAIRTPVSFVGAQDARRPARFGSMRTKTENIRFAFDSNKIKVKVK